MNRILLTLVICAPVPAAEPDQLAQRGVLQLSLKRAIEFGLAPEGNANIQLAGEEIHQAKARSAQARAALLPDSAGTISVSNQTLNLASMGLNGDRGLGLPRSVGPFTVIGARASVEQNVLNLGAIRRYQASKTGIRAVESSYSDTQDQIASRIASRYLAALRAEASLQAIDENVKLADAILKQAEKLSLAGTGTGIEVTRARVVLANETQRRLVAELERSRTRQELLRVMGMRLDTAFELTDQLTYTAVEIPDVETKKAEALQKRSDLKAQIERQEQARQDASAAKLDRTPVIKAFGDYGSIGSGFNSILPTRSAGLSVEVPLFDGGRRRAKLAENESLHRQEKVRTNDLLDQIELQVRLAIDVLRSAEREVEVASDGLSLAEKELVQARRRYEVGVANSVEVVDAQSRLAQARDNRVAALYRHNVARMELATATGTVQEYLQQN